MRRIRGEMRKRTLPGLSVPQYRTLNYLREHRGASLSEVAEFLSLTRPSASKLIQRLVTQRIITRRVGADRRRVSLSLTVTGRRALVVARMETHQQLANGLEALSPEELRTISTALGLLQRAFSKDGTEPQAG